MDKDKQQLLQQQQQQELYDASFAGDLLKVQFLLQQGTDPNPQSIDTDQEQMWGIPVPPLCVARTVAIANVLIGHGARLEAQDECVGTPLHNAVCYHHGKNTSTHLVQFLLDQGANVEARNLYGRTPLHVAAAATTTTTATTAGSDKHRRLPSSSVVDLLLDRGAYLEATDLHQNTPLHCAVLFGRTHVLQVLLDRGARIDAVNQDGDTPLHVAMCHGQLEAAQLLLLHQNRKEDCASNRLVHAVNKNGETPLHLASATAAAHSKAHDVVRVVQLLLDSGGANLLQARDCRGQTSLVYAARQGNNNATVVQLLMERGAWIG